MLNLFGQYMSRGGLSLNNTFAAANRALITNQNLPMRRLKLHEYQAGKLLHKYKVPIPLGNVAFNGKEAYLVAKQFGQKKADMEYVVKAQILGGGRGLGHFKENNFKGGVHIVKTADEV